MTLMSRNQQIIASFKPDRISILIHQLRFTLQQQYPFIARLIVPFAKNQTESGAVW
jgi:hypothetical protein